MNRNQIKISATGFLLLALLLMFASCGHQEKKSPPPQIVRNSFYYTCSMHPQVHEDHPGNCPICGMKLIRVEMTAVNNNQADRITLTAVQIQLGGIQTDTVREAYTGEEKVINGTITPDENAAGELSARLPGRIQRLFIRTTGETVRAGQPVYSLYSEDLQEAEKEYLLAREQQQKLHNPDVDYPALIGAAENKLRLWGLTSAQIAGLVRSGKISPTTTIVSNVSGTVSELNVHEGDYVTEGMTILKTQELGSLWVEAQLYSNEASELRVGQLVNVSFPDLNGQTTQGKVSFINPELSDASKVDLVRINIPNPQGLLRPGMQANVRVGGGSRSLAVPTSAVITDGKGSTVWVKNHDGSFSARMVKLGLGNRSYVQLESGISRGEIVVTNGTYLLNSEAIFRNGSDRGSMAGMKM
ncbi:MAG TPA: efflux RND transporter periplasmic adaptor subunit [Mucilaginibacter sp.]|nr:efflux RND transporter periplasmic adaptor subunit [Mucilaginibacter sp.]